MSAPTYSPNVFDVLRRELDVELVPGTSLLALTADGIEVLTMPAPDMATLLQRGLHLANLVADRDKQGERR